jgi:hypothetical protein
MRSPSRPHLLLAAAVGVLALAACGEASPSADTTETTVAPTTVPPTTNPPTTVPPTTEPPAPAGYDHPTGADDVVIEITFEGGFVPVDLAFTQPPTLLITGDGRAITQGAVLAIYPGPLLPALVERTISEDGIQTLLAKADELGLLADVEYGDPPTPVTDVPDTVVTITANGTTYRHAAYALGISDEPEQARANLFEFVTAASDLATTVGESELGTEAPFESDSYLIRATPVDPATMTTELPPTYVDWPADASVRLADAAECAELPAAEGDPLFADATQLTFFNDGGVTYSVAATLRVPGRTC